MKSLLTTIISLVIGVGIGSTTTYYLTANKTSTESLPVQTSVNKASSDEIYNTEVAPVRNAVKTALSGEIDNFEIRWIGKATNNFFYGNYSIVEKDKPSRLESVPKTPHIVKFKLPKGASVSAAGNSQDVRIFRNGKECGETQVVGSQVISNKTCFSEELKNLFPGL
ncbi:hypothetical protein [Sphaerospermopsis sp. LEGE 08334]|uniref:hypothetical protein n=1 Tax=Sphaerospermopsis sp. LEGE 08334 TaxID=1828651 RepID=UPI00188115E6|nr:hypothetical protein [Sphaerospermopsis sp. LEGE 08334]MBE9058503.1 hypothetical protein [Sphaerospermopsis sp. LEGE 08334]